MARLVSAAPRRSIFKLINYACSGPGLDLSTSLPLSFVGGQTPGEIACIMNHLKQWNADEDGARGREGESGLRAGEREASSSPRGDRRVS